MRAIDTNVLVRLLTRDDARQAAAAERFVANGAWVSHLVLAELTWVLTEVYRLDHARIAAAVEMLLNHKQIAIDGADVVASALVQYRKKPALGFSDCLVLELARQAGHVPLGTFDRNLGRLKGTESLAPQGR